MIALNITQKSTPMNDLVCRAATNKDFLALAELDRKGWGQNRHSEFIADGEHIWRVWVEHAIVKATFKESKAVGLIVAIPTNDQGLYFIHKIIVDPDSRDQGIGTMLFKELFKETDSLGVRTSLTTDSNNLRMHHICEKLGYTHKEFIKGYYRPHEDRYVLTRMPK